MDQDKKIGRNFSIRISQADWLEQQAAGLTIKSGTRVTASDIVTRLIDDAQEHDARISRILKNILAESQAA